MTEACVSNITEIPDSPVEPVARWQQRLAVGGAIGILLLSESCSLSDNNSQPHQPGGGRSSHNTACLQPEVDVFPASAFNADNRHDLQDQISTLKVAHSPHAEVTVRNIFDATAIVTNSLRDPLYAEAFSDANKHIFSVRSADQLLQKGYRTGDGGCLQREQIIETAQLYKSLQEGLAPKAGRQISIAAVATYHALEAAYQAFKDKYHKELSPQNKLR